MLRRFILLLAALVMLVILVGAVELLPAVYAVATATTISLVWFRRGPARLEITRRAAERAFPGDHVEVVLEVRNSGRLPVPWVELHERLPTALALPPSHREVTALRSGETRRVTYRLTPKRRGYHRIGPLQARTGDLLGLADRVKEVAPSSPLIVYPEVVPLEALGLPAHAPYPSRRTPVPLHPDPTLVRGVRPYEAGDPQRSIHWRASARLGALQTKQHEHGTSRETILCLDLARSSYPAGYRASGPELAIVTAASLANHLVAREGQSTGLLTEAHDPLGGGTVAFHRTVGSRRAHLAEILEILARVEPANVAPIADHLQAASSSLPWAATLVTITGAVTDELVAMLFRLRRLGFAPTVISVLPEPASEAALRRARQFGVGAERVRDRRGLEMLGARVQAAT